MRYQVPQFIEVEDKIFGPLTLNQFIYLAGGGAAIFLLYVSLPFFLFVILAVPVGIFSLGLAFYQINGQPLIRVTENALNHYMKTKVYTWQKRTPKVEKTASAKQKPPTQPTLQAPVLTESKLSELAWSLDIKSKIDNH